MTVKMLRKKLEKLPDDLTVIICVKDQPYMEIEKVVDERICGPDNLMVVLIAKEDQ